MRLVIDTNVFVSFALNSTSPTALVVDSIMAAHTPLHSPAMIAELVATLSKPKFAMYVRQDSIDLLVSTYLHVGEQVQVLDPIVVCRDPKDDEFLSVAVAGKADAIVTGDNDLLSLHPFRGIDILRPAEIANRL